MAIQIRNSGNTPFTLPSPFCGVLAPGRGVIVDSTVDVFLAACGGFDTLAGYVNVYEIGEASAEQMDPQFGPTSSAKAIRLPVRAALETNINLASPGATLDGVTMAVGDRFGAFGQTSAPARGIYIWAGATKPMLRAPDFDTDSGVISGTLVIVSEGTLNADKLYELTTNAPIVIGTTSLTFAQVNGGAGGPISSLVLTEETVSSSTAISPTIPVTLVDSNAGGALNLTLAVGAAGQKKEITLIRANLTAVIASTNLKSGANITLSNVGDSVHLVSDGAKWCQTAVHTPATNAVPGYATAVQVAAVEASTLADAAIVAGKLGYESVLALGALSLAKATSGLQAVASGAYTLADGTDGQHKWLLLGVTQTVTITGTGDVAAWTGKAAGDYFHGVFITGAGWVALDSRATP